jgi:hypothetical protein
LQDRIYTPGFEALGSITLKRYLASKIQYCKILKSEKQSHISTFLTDYIMPLKHIGIFFVALLTLGGCIKDLIPGLNRSTPPPELPPITTTGENTFGCLNNGAVWLPENTPHISGGIDEVTVRYRDGKFSILAIKDPSGDEANINQVIDLNVVGELAGFVPLHYPDESSSGAYVGKYATYHNYITGCEYVTDSIQPGHVQFLRFDSVARIVSGTFEMTLAEPGCDTIFIRDGRFDLGY